VWIVDDWVRASNKFITAILRLLSIRSSFPSSVVGRYGLNFGQKLPAVYLPKEARGIATYYPLLKQLSFRNPRHLQKPQLSSHKLKMGNRAEIPIITHNAPQKGDQSNEDTLSRVTIHIQTCH
jgi:hypothetical protein